eukprot:6122958-Amphidinium_carterae.1
MQAELNELPYMAEHGLVIRLSGVKEQPHSRRALEKKRSKASSSRSVTSESFVALASGTSDLPAKLDHSGSSSNSNSPQNGCNQGARKKELCYLLVGILFFEVELACQELLERFDTATDAEEVLPGRIELVAPNGLKFGKPKARM